MLAKHSKLFFELAKNLENFKILQKAIDKNIKIIFINDKEYKFQKVGKNSYSKIILTDHNIK